MKKYYRLLCLLLTAGILCSCTPTDVADTTVPDGTQTSADTTSAPETDRVVQIPEIETSTLGEANVAYDCPVIMNSCEGGSNQQLTDGDAQTGASTILKENTSDPNRAYEIVIDLTKTYKLTGVKLLPHKTLAFPTAYTVSTSINGTDYTPAASETDRAATGEDGVTTRFEAEARYIKITSDDLGEKASKGYVLALGEVLAYSEITNEDNILVSKYALSLQPGSKDTLTVSYRLPEYAGTEVKYLCPEYSLVDINEQTGELTALACGEGTIYVTDGKNITKCPFTVSEKEKNFVTSTFYLANHGDNSIATLNLLKESGIEFLENCRPYDNYGNDVSKYLLTLCADRGLTLSEADPQFESYLNMTNEQIAEIVKKYKNLPSFGGLYILDEPLYANKYARVYNAMVAEDPTLTPHLNLLPGGMSDFHGYVSDWCAAVGAENMKYLSYDNYPYGAGANSFNSYVYSTLNELRTTAIAYGGIDTAYYIQAMGIVGAYRVPDEGEMTYNVSLGLAYGMKNYKWFVWFTPPYYGSGEHFTTGILDSDYNKSEMFDSVVKLNAEIKTLGKYLYNTDALEVYHTAGSDGTRLPENFAMYSGKSVNLIYTLYVDRETGKNYIGITNKNYKRAVTPDVTLSAALLASGDVFDVTTGERVKLTVNGGVFSPSIPAGGFVLYELPDGFNAASAKDEGGNLLSGLGFSVSSSDGMTSFAYKLTDGKRTNGSWMSVDGEENAWVSCKFSKSTELNRLDVYPSGDGYAYGTFFPTALSLWYSEDGVNWTKACSAENLTGEACVSLKFDKITARYLKLVCDGQKNLTGSLKAEIGELEAYLDDGSVPSPDAFTMKALPETGNKALGMKTYVSSSYEEYNWTQAALTNGKKTYTEGTEQGWCSMIGTQKADSSEWIMIDFGRATTVSSVVLYPSGTNFARDYCAEVSVDGVNWTTVASVTNDTNYTDTEKTLSFDETSARYVRFRMTKHGKKSSMAAVGFVLQIVEIEIY